MARLRAVVLTVTLADRKEKYINIAINDIVKVKVSNYGHESDGSNCFEARIAAIDTVNKTITYDVSTRMNKKELTFDMYNIKEIEVLE